VTTLFGHCLAAPGTRPDHYHHSLCRREYVDASGVRHVCGCPNHESDEEMRD
jgi:hypothetical protein